MKTDLNPLSQKHSQFRPRRTESKACKNPGRGVAVCECGHQGHVRSHRTCAMDHHLVTRRARRLFPAVAAEGLKIPRDLAEIKAIAAQFDMEITGPPVVIAGPQASRRYYTIKEISSFPSNRFAGGLGTKAVGGLRPRGHISWGPRPFHENQDPNFTFPISRRKRRPH